MRWALFPLVATLTVVCTTANAFFPVPFVAEAEPSFDRSDFLKIVEICTEPSSLRVSEGSGNRRLRNADREFNELFWFDNDSDASKVYALRDTDMRLMQAAVALIKRGDLDPADTDRAKQWAVWFANKSVNHVEETVNVEDALPFDENPATLTSITFRTVSLDNFLTVLEDPKKRICVLLTTQDIFQLGFVVQHPSSREYLEGYTETYQQTGQGFLSLATTYHKDSFAFLGIDLGKSETLSKVVIFLDKTD